MAVGRLDVNDAVINQLKVLRRNENVKKFTSGSLPKWLHPTPISRYYNRHLQRYVSGLVSVVKETLLSNLAPVVEERLRADDWADDAQRLLETMAIGFTKVPLNISNLAYDVAGKTDVWNDRQWRKIMKAGLGVELIQNEPWLEPLTKSFVAENTGLITKMTTDMKENIGGKLQRGLRSGTSHQSLAKEIQKEFKTTRNRAKLIARDQVSKLNGQMTKERQTQIGVDDYTWKTNIDGRERPTHRANNNKDFDWDKAPSNTGHPGEDIQCRCYGEPNFDSILEQL